MKRYFLTHIAPQDKILEYGVSSATCNFSYNLISGSGFDKVFSILPTFVLGKKFFCEYNDVDYIYSSWRWSNKLFQKLAPIIENFILFKKIEKSSSLWLYNLTMLNVWLVLLLRWFKPSVQVNVIVLDFTPGEKYSNFFLRQINKCHGRILLANSPLFNKENSAILPGVTPIEQNKEYPKVTEIKKEFLLSGILSENIAMVSMVLPAFSKMPDCTLHITGMASDDTQISEFAAKYPNIIYHGKVKFEEYLEILGNTPFLLSTRNPAFPENQCNFPSKIIEALLFNRIIVSTLHYEQLKGIRYFEVPTDIDGFIEMLKQVTSLSDVELMDYANQSKDVQEMFSTEVWNDTMTTIEGLS